MLKECYSPIKKLLKPLPSLAIQWHPPQTWFSLSFILCNLTLSSSLMALPARVGGRAKARTAVGYSIDFGVAASKLSSTE